MNIQAKPLNQINQEAIKILSKEIGITDTIRFLNQFSHSYGNYTEEREDKFKDLSLNDILQQIQNKK